MYVIISYDGNKLIKWTGVLAAEGVAAVVQYLIDGINDPDIFYVYNTETGGSISLLNAAEALGISKRSFYDRIMDA